MNAPARQRRPLCAMLAANIVSQIGNSLSYIVIPWFVLEITGSAARMGLTAAAAVVPLVIAGFFGGALVDRLGYKRMSVISDVASAGAVALIPLLHLTIGLEFWQLLALVFLGAVLDSPGMTARTSLYPELAGLAGMRLERANSIWMVSRRLAGLLAAPAGGLLIVVIGASNVLWINAASFLISAAIITLFVPQPPATAGEERAPYLSELLDGLRFIRRDRLILWMLIVFTTGGFLAEPLYSVVLPVYANQVFGSALDLGFMMAALAGGSIAGGVIYGFIGHLLPRRLTYLVGFSVRAATFWVFVTMPSLWVIVLAIVVNAIMLEPSNPLSMTIFQERIPEGMRGRVFGTLTALGVAAMPLGMVAYGFLLSGLGLHTTLWVLATVNIVLPALILFAPAFREMDTPHVSQPHANQRSLAA
jgi:MFS family permease